jgi:hypothetical protein
MASLSIELCAFTVAIALDTKPIRAFNYQSSVVELTYELRSSNLNFRVDMLPLHHGSNIFKKPIESLDDTIVSMSSKGIDCTEYFVDRNDIRRGSDIIFDSAGLVVERT